MTKQFLVLLVGVFNTLLIIGVIVTPITVTWERPWQRPESDGPVLRLDTSRVVVLPPSAGLVPWRCEIDFPLLRTGFYQLNSALTAQVTADLSAYLPGVERSLQFYGGIERPPLNDYYIQYLGVHLSGGAKLVIINAFAEYSSPRRPMEPFWRRRLVDMCDGGFGYWHLDYDPVLRRFRGFHFNGAG